MGTEPLISVPRFAAEMMAIGSRNLQALLDAQNAMLDGNKTLLERQMEVCRSSLDALLKAAHDIGSEPDLRSSVGKQFEATKNLISDSVGNSNIISEVSARGNAQVIQILQGRLRAMIDEMQAAFDKVLSDQSVTKPPPATTVRAA
jgi:phasin family protein